MNLIYNPVCVSNACNDYIGKIQYHVCWLEFKLHCRTMTAKTPPNIDCLSFYLHRKKPRLKHHSTIFIPHKVEVNNPVGRITLFKTTWFCNKSLVDVSSVNAVGDSSQHCLVLMRIDLL